MHANPLLQDRSVFFSVPPLRFEADDLTPAMSRRALEAHHEAVHQGYAAAINRMLAPYPQFAGQRIEQVLQQPEALPPQIRDAALGLRGPGFAFLSLAAPRTDRLEVVALVGNGSVLTIGKPGILICDLWDHAWQADHASRRHWLAAFWTIVDWGVLRAALPGAAGRPAAGLKAPDWP